MIYFDYIQYVTNKQITVSLILKSSLQVNCVRSFHYIGINIFNHDLFHRIILGTSFDILDLCHYIGTIHSVTKNAVFSVKPASLDSGDEKLSTVCVRARICHWKRKWIMFSGLHILIIKFRTINGWTTKTFTSFIISTLNHKLFNNAMEDSALICLLIFISWCFLGNFKEIFNCFWLYFTKKPECNISKNFISMLHLKDHVVGYFRWLY